MQLKFAGLSEKWRALSPGQSAAAYWAGFLVLLMLAGMPFVVLSVTAPSSDTEREVDVVGLSRPAPGPSSPTPGLQSPTAFAEVEAPGARPPASRPRPDDTSPAIDPSLTKAVSDFRGSDFQVQCWPAMTVLPGASSTVDCSILLSRGFSSVISLTCRVAGMSCAMSPDVIKPVNDVDMITTRLTVTAPEGVPVGTRPVSVTAAGGRAGAPLKQADVDVNVPPPFSMSCESVGVSFQQGEIATLKCWVTFLDGSPEDVALSIKNGAGLPAGLDVKTLSPVPNQTKAFTIELDTDALDSRTYSLLVGASSPRYQQDATARFDVVRVP